MEVFQAHYYGCPLSPTTRLRLSPLGAPLAQAGSEYLCNRLHKLRANESVCEAEVRLLGGAGKRAHKGVELESGISSICGNG
jgi:hypothetical protein